MEIKGYENYTITRDGKVFNNTGKELKQHKTYEHSNFRVQLSKNGKSKNFQVNRLVAEHYIRKIEEDEIVKHIDKNNSNNKVENLEIKFDENVAKHRKACSIHFKKEPKV